MYPTLSLYLRYWLEENAGRNKRFKLFALGFVLYQMCPNTMKEGYRIQTHFTVAFICFSSELSEVYATLLIFIPHGVDETNLCCPGCNDGQSKKKNHISMAQ